MGDVDPDVAKFFEVQYSVWKNALSRWHKKCGGKIEEHKQRQKRSYPVADRRNVRSGFQEGATLSDATLYGYPSKSVEDQTKDDDVAKQAGKCKDTIAHIQKVMELLNNARTTGRFPSIRNTSISLRSKPSFITNIERAHKVDRGGVIEAAEKKGDWLRVKSGDAEGWIHKTDLIPELPIEYSSAPGTGGPKSGSTRKEMGEGGRG